MIKRYKYLFFLVLVAVVFTGCSVSVSSPGSVEGYVYIPTGYLAAQSSTELEPLFKAQAKPPVNYEPLVGANVRVVGRAERGKTDETGYFKISGLPAGHYRLRVSHPGIRSVEKGVNIYSGTPTWLEADVGVAYYVVIGIDLYSKEPPIYGPYNDAVEVYDTLYERNALAGRSRLLVQEGTYIDPETEPTRTNIKKAITDAANLSTSEHDYLVIYFSGESGANFLRPSDDIGGNNRITDGELEEWVRKFGGTVTLIIDAHEAETFADGPVLESQAFKKSYYTVLGATRKNQDAGAHEDRYHSWFTYHLLEGIRTRDADYNRDGDITASELYEYTYGAMQGDSSQTPFFWPGTNGNAVVYRYKR